MKGLQLLLTAQDADNKFSGEILLYDYVIGTFKVETGQGVFADEPRRVVERADYFFDEIKIADDEFISTLDKLAYTLDYDEFALPTKKDRDVMMNEAVLRVYHKVDRDWTIGDIMEEIYDNWATELYQYPDGHEDDSTSRGKEIEELRSDFTDECYSRVMATKSGYDTKLGKAEAKIVELKKELKETNSLIEEHNREMIIVACDLAEEELANELAISTEYLYDDEGSLMEKFQDRFNTIYDGYANTLQITEKM